MEERGRIRELVANGEKTFYFLQPAAMYGKVVEKKRRKKREVRQYMKIKNRYVHDNEADYLPYRKIRKRGTGAERNKKNGRC